MVVDRGHLGGYIPGGDPDSFYPKLWEWIVGQYGIRSMLDVGCGEGVAVDFFDSLGVVAVGVDGVEQEKACIYQHDYTLGPWEPYDLYDLVWSCEFVEHVEEQFIPNFLATFQAAPLLLMTHALPGQGGHHHVNCQDDAYWIRQLAAVGFGIDPDLTATTRSLAHSYYARSGLAFRKIDARG